MKTKKSKTMRCFEKIFFIAFATIIFTLLMSVSSVRADVTASWDNTTKTLSISGSGEITEAIVNAKVDNKAKIRIVTIKGNDITSIGDDAFNGCTNLESINIPSSITTIGSRAFSGCSTLKEITIPQNVTSIGIDAFSDCTETIIYIPEGLASPESTSILEDLQYSYYKTATSKANSSPVTSYHKNLSTTKGDPTSSCKITIKSSTCDITVVVVENESSGGGYAISSDVSVPSNTKLRVYATAKDGYENPKITATISIPDDHVSPLNLNSGDCFDVTGNTTISASAVKKLYTLTLKTTPILDISNITVTITKNEPDGTSISSSKASSLQEIDYGYSVKLEAPSEDGYDFIGWFLNGKIVTSNITYTFTMYNNVSYEARYKVSSSKTVAFKAKGQVINIIEVINAYSLPDDFTLPTAPKYHGWTFIGWKVNGSMTTSSNVLTDINTALKEKNIVPVEASYEPTKEEKDSSHDGKITVTLMKKNITDSVVSTESISYDESKWVTYKSLGSDTEIFSHWELDDEKISTNTTVSFRVTKDCKLTAVYVEPATSSFEIQRVIYERGKITLKATLPATIEVSSVKKVAFQYGTSSTLPEDSPTVLCEENPILDGNSATYVATIVTSNTSNNYYVKPIIIYTNTGTFEPILTSTEGDILASSTIIRQNKLIVKAELKGVGKGMVNEVKFKCKKVEPTTENPTPEEEFIVCKVNPYDGIGEDNTYTYVAEIPGVTLGTDYHIQPVATLTDGTSVTGDEITVDPESGYDTDEKVCAVIISHSKNSSDGATFVAYISIPTDSEINKAGVIATQTTNLNEVLDFNNAKYVKEWTPTTIKESKLPLIYTWTKLSIESGKKIYVRPYVIYTQTSSSNTTTLIGKRVYL